MRNRLTAPHHSHDGYAFRADAEGVTIEPGPKLITLNRAEVEQLGLAIRDDYKGAYEMGTGLTP